MREALKLADQPDAAWTQLKPYQKFITTKTVRDSSQAKEGYLRIVCISDTHGLHEEAPVPDGDILIHAGKNANLAYTVWEWYVAWSHDGSTLLFSIVPPLPF